jgi:hypothetical protein
LAALWTPNYWESTRLLLSAAQRTLASAPSPIAPDAVKPLCTSGAAVMFACLPSKARDTA